MEILDCAPGYQEYRYSHPIETHITEWGHRGPVQAPVLAGLALRFCRPAVLDELLDWAEVVVVEHPWQFSYCRQRIKRAAVVYSAHNIEADRAGSFLRAAGWPRGSQAWLRLVRHFEAKVAPAADLVFTVSDADCDALIARYGAAPDRVITIPNGADVEALHPVSPEVRASAKRPLGLPDQPAVIFVAGPNRGAGLPAVRWIERCAAAAPELTFLIVGSLFPQARQAGNRVITGPVDRLPDYYRAADLAICPIEFGGGTKIKLMEALAAGLPTVAFAESLHGTEFVDGEHLLVAEKSVDSLTGCLRRLRDDRDLAAFLSHNARAIAAGKHDWKKGAAAMCAALERLAAGKA